MARITEANINPRLLRGLSAAQASRADRRSTKYLNVPSNGFASRGEELYHSQLETQRHALNPRDRVVDIQPQVRYLLIPPQHDEHGLLIEKSCSYVCDFRVEYADGRVEVVDCKSPVTRTLPVYVLKRKLMLQVHGIRLVEIGD